MSQKENIKIKIKRSGDKYQVIDNNSSFLRKQANDNYLNKTTTYKRTSTNLKTQQKNLETNTKTNTKSIQKGVDSKGMYLNITPSHDTQLSRNFQHAKLNLNNDI